MVRKLFKIAVMILLFWLFLHINNTWLQTTEYTISSERIPSAFNGVKIVQISDLHDANFGENQERLVKKLKAIKPDLVFITGDFIDSNRYDLENSLDLVKQIVPLAKVFYVIGNHEVAVNKIDEITDALSAMGVHILRNESQIIERGKDRLVIAGIDDPLMAGQVKADVAIGQYIDLTMQTTPKDMYTILLSHRPEVFDVYVKKKIDLIFTGHAHGGQIRIPGLGGLVAPGQGWFPTYTAGKFIDQDTTMIVSRGLGNSIIPYRVFNRPELIVVTLESTT